MKMESNIDLSKLWKQQYVPQVDSQEIFDKIKKLKRTSFYETIAMNVSLLATVFIIIIIGIYFKPELPSTKTGMLLTVSTIVMALVAHNKTLSLYRKPDKTDSNAGYLQTLLEIKKQQQRMQTTIMSLYFIFLSLGIGLYMYEYIILLPLIMGVTAYTLIGIWIAFNWWVLRPKIIKKNTKKLNDLIQQLENLNSQFNNNPMR